MQAGFESEIRSQSRSLQLVNSFRRRNQKAINRKLGHWASFKA